MGKIKIYLSFRDGELIYRDSEEHKGQTITTSVDPGDSITWKLDQCSGIKDIKSITVIGEKDFFKDGPEKKDFDTWKADVSKKATGEISYVVQVDVCDCCTEGVKAGATAKQVGEPQPPIIRVEV